MSAGLRAQVDPEKAPKLRFAAESGKSYPVAILVGPSWRLPEKGGLPWCCAFHSTCAVS